MTDQPPHGDTSDDARVESDRESTTGIPLWVKAFGIILLLVVLLLIIVLLAGGHDPGGHT